MLAFKSVFPVFNCALFQVATTCRLVEGDSVKSDPSKVVTTGTSGRCAMAAFEPENVVAQPNGQNIDVSWNPGYLNACIFERWEVQIMDAHTSAWETRSCDFSPFYRTPPAPDTSRRALALTDTLRYQVKQLGGLGSNYSSIQRFCTILLVQICFSPCIQRCCTSLVVQIWFYQCMKLNRYCT